MSETGRCPECQVVGGHHPECPHDQPPRVWRPQPGAGVGWERPPLVPVLEACPNCGEPDVVRMVADWQRRVHEDRTPIPVIGCGAPWHYANLDGPTLDPIAQGATLAAGQQA